MERMLVVIFDSEAKAYEGTRALIELDREGSISVHSGSVIQKHADGAVTVKRTEDEFPIRALAGTAIGALFGLLGGPIGVGVGAATGGTVGLIGEIYVADVSVDFLNEVSAALKPGKWAVLAEISEEWTTPIDERMERLGGMVHRTVREHFEEERKARELAALKAEIKLLQDERAQARADRKAELQAKIDGLNKKLQQKIEQAKERAEQVQKETDSKIEALNRKAAKAQGDAKAAIEARIAEIKAQHEQSAARLRNAIAEDLRKAAARVEKPEAA